MMTELATNASTRMKASIDFLAIADEVYRGVCRKAAPTSPISYGAPLASIALNIGRGRGEFARQGKGSFLPDGHGRSATECGAVLDVCARLGLAVRPRD
jgi:hypothetical protein